MKIGNSASVRRGLRALAIALAAVILCAAVNLGVSRIPTKYTKFDTSTDEFITLSDQSKRILASLDADVTLYWLVTAGSENETLSLLLGRYADESARIHVEKIDLTRDPEFGKQYTEKTIFENSVIAVSGQKSEYVSYYKIYNYDDSDYVSTGKMTITFEGENRLTNAIHYVTSDSVPTVYTLTGHGETELTDEFDKAIGNDNLVVQPLSLLGKDAVPDDCAALLVNSPTVDLSAEDAEKVRAYLAGGGHLLLFTTNVEEDALPNLRAILREDYGVGLTEGIVLEGSDYYYVSQPYHLLPKMHTHAITEPLVSGNLLALVPFAQPMVLYADKPESVTVTSLFTTTDASYCKADGYHLSSLEKASDDRPGPFTVGAAIESASGAKIVWIPTGYFLDSGVDAQVSGGNTNLVLNALSWMCGQTESIAVRPRLVAEDYFTLSSAAARNFAIGFIGLVPAAFLICGSVIWARRRRR